VRFDATVASAQARPPGQSHPALWLAELPDDDDAARLLVASEKKQRELM
jgi:hypothetical protein